MLRRVWLSLALVGILIFGPAEVGRYVFGPAEAGHYLLSAQQEEPTSPRVASPVTFLQINDVYSTVPIDGLGGLARVATLKQQLAAAGKTPVLVTLRGNLGRYRNASPPSAGPPRARPPFPLNHGPTGRGTES